MDYKKYIHHRRNTYLIKYKMSKMFKFHGFLLLCTSKLTYYQYLSCCEFRDGYDL